MKCARLFISKVACQSCWIYCTSTPSHPRPTFCICLRVTTSLPSTSPTSSHTFHRHFRCCRVTSTITPRSREPAISTFLLLYQPRPPRRQAPAYLKSRHQIIASRLARHGRLLQCPRATRSRPAGPTAACAVVVQRSHRQRRR
jgi:hypothetical protein